MAFNLDKVIAGMSFGFPSSEQIDEAIGMLLSYPATQEGAALLSVYSFELQTSWPRLYHEALLLLQRTRAIEAIDASNAARREKKRKYNRDRDESIRVAEVFNGRRDQLVGIDLKVRVRLVGIVRPRRRESHANMASASAALPPVVAGAGAGAAESMTDEDPSSD